MVHFFDSMPEDMQTFIRKQPIFFTASAPLSGKHVNVSPKASFCSKWLNSSGHPSRTFAILNPNKVAYLDWSGSSSETISHIYENGRVTVMFNSFMTAPMIVRLYCKGSVIERDDPAFRPMVEEMHKAGMQRHEPNQKFHDTVQAELDRQEQEAADRRLNGDAESSSPEDDDDGGSKKKRSFRPYDVDMRPTDGIGLVGCRAIVVLDVWKCMRSCGFGVPLVMMGDDGKLSEGREDQQAAATDTEQKKVEKGVNTPVIDEDNTADLPSPPATPTQSVHQPRSQDVYDRTGVQFDEHWDDRTRMDSWNAKMVVSGQLEAYRRKYNHLSLDGLPGIRMTCIDWQERLSIQLDALFRRVFIDQWRILIFGMVLALVLRRLIVHSWEAVMS